MTVHFLGGAGTVTGSKTIIEHNGVYILVDCGLFQGVKELRELNRAPLQIDPKFISYVILTHGHLDHCGWLPKLVKEGFQGKIYCTRPTKKIAQLILLDSAKIQEEEAQKANEEHYSKHEPAEPLYTVSDAEKVTPYFKVVGTDVDVELSNEIRFRFFYAGHILGACSVSLEIGGKILVFSGDIGQSDDVLMFAPVKPVKADYVFLESTYGNRIHPSGNVEDEMERIINQTITRGGNVVIPSFAVERAQTVMYLLWQLRLANKIPDVPYIIDTPMGIQVLDVFLENPRWHRLNPQQCIEMCDMFRLVSDFQDTIDTVYDPNPKVIIAASGMVTGGRVLTYLERYISQKENTVVLVGYQAEGTRGRMLLEGAEEIRFYGKYYPVKAEVVYVEGLSAHADQQDLMSWMGELQYAPKTVFLVHGEDESTSELKNKIEEAYGFLVEIPALGQKKEL